METNTPTVVKSSKKRKRRGSPVVPQPGSAGMEADREKANGVENAYAIELSNMTDVNQELQLTVHGYEMKAAEAAMKLK